MLIYKVSEQLELVTLILVCLPGSQLPEEKPYMIKESISEYLDNEVYLDTYHEWTKTYEWGLRKCV